MRDEGKWTRRAKWIVSSVATVLFMVFICTMVLSTMQSVKVVQATTDSPTNDSLVQVSGKPDGDVIGLPIEKASVYDLLKISGYGSTVEDIPDIPSGCDSEVLARSISEMISNLSDNSKVVLNLEHQMPTDIPAPSLVWIRNQDDSYPVILLFEDEDMVTVSDPSRGMVRYPVSEFVEVYNDAGSQSVYIADRGYNLK